MKIKVPYWVLWEICTDSSRTRVLPCSNEVELVGIRLATAYSLRQYQSGFQFGKGGRAPCSHVRTPQCSNLGIRVRVRINNHAFPGEVSQSVGSIDLKLGEYPPIITDGRIEELVHGILPHVLNPLSIIE